MSRVVIAGGSGFLGRALARSLSPRGEVIVLSRSAAPVPGARSVHWDGRTVGEWVRELEGAEAVINLSGESIAQRWTPDARRRIADSRLESTRAVGDGIARCARPPRAWLNASAVGFYGDTGDREADESAPPGEDELSLLCVAWERALWESPVRGVRRVALRIGVPLGREGGVFPLLWNLSRWFLGGAVGSGRNWVPWIHERDFCGIVEQALDGVHEGPLNVVGPAPCTMNELMREIRRAARRPWAPNAPFALARLAELFGAPPARLAVQSSRVVSTVLREAAYPYRFPDLRSGIAELASRGRPAAG